ncbi:MAG: isopeptide-forming domain-containing fimbrial protein [Bifidobacterium crudilactis]|nr:isopeptide-forming domain-containing fimbrial protein [Bifidobacterium crudilactis]
MSSAKADDTQVGSTLVTEDFTGSSVKDSRWTAMGGACLTAATTATEAAADSGQSNLRTCSNTTDTGYLKGVSNGFLQMTDNSRGTASDVLFNRAIPSRSGLDISFYQYQFHTTGTDLGPADGIGFFLTDGSYTLNAAGPTGDGYGGALGYASIEKQSGIAHGALGLGLDVYGNYSAQPYVGTSCTNTKHGRTQNSVVLRGAGDGTQGYCLMQNDAGSYTTSSDALQTSAPEAGVAGANNGTLVRVVISPTTDTDPYPSVSVSLNGKVVSTYKLTTQLPSTVKFGFASSTGGGHEAHLIRTVAVKSVNPLNALSLVKTVNHNSSLGGTDKKVFAAGDTVPYSFLVTNTGQETLKNISVSDAKINGQPSNSKVTCTEPAGGLQPADSMTCTGTYGPLSAEEAQNGHFDNTAIAQGFNDGGTTVKSNESTATIPLYTTADFSVQKQVTGGASRAVNDSQTYTVKYSYEPGKYQYCAADGTLNPTDTTESFPAGKGTLQVKADGTAVSSGQIPTGAVVTLAEQTPADIPGVSWGAATFSPSGLTIGCQGATTSATLTNTANQQLGSVAWSKSDSGTKALIAGSQWQLTLPDGSKKTVVDNGDHDADPAEGKLKVTGLAWGKYSLEETKAPSGYLIKSKPISFEVSSDHLVAELGQIENDKGSAGLVIKKTSDPQSGATVAPGATVTYTVTASNTGNVELKPVTVVDDLSKVLSNSTYVQGSLRSTIDGKTSGTAQIEGSSLKWEGTLGAGQSVDLVYKVVVSEHATDGTTLVNVVSGTGVPPEGVDPPTPNCTTENQTTNPDCTTQTKVVVPPTPATPTTPAAPGKPGTPGQPSVPSTHLATTGASVAPIAGGVVLLMLVGCATLLLRRRENMKSERR